MVWGLSWRMGRKGQPRKQGDRLRMQLSAVEFIPAGLALSLLWEKRTGPFPLQQEEPVHEALPPWAALCGLR